MKCITCKAAGLLEEIYQQSLEIELELRSIPFLRKEELKVYYKGRELKKRYNPDLFVYGCIVVELKSVAAIAPEHDARLMNYMRITRSPIRLPDQLRPDRKAAIQTIHPLGVPTK